MPPGPSFTQGDFTTISCIHHSWLLWIIPPGTYFSQLSLSPASFKFPWLQEVHSESFIMKLLLHSLSVELNLYWNEKLPPWIIILSSASEAICLLPLGNTGSFGKHMVYHNKCLMLLVMEKFRHRWLILFESSLLGWDRLLSFKECS